ncbi:TVP38/TMEM64 family protein [Deferribacterales bacterium Es71-Z0220]|uniref:TVP38/TMEM64 family protein n=1 Tax=Deferrivibrio essentukiensis TaxID=2880922 RepID=UPI001F616CA0|nr:TVP38/TMEM64 family protein [Deferrivibrio essentukiensis]MCB4205353.1 TVP38/TMEM64 family protein [Deferrivibrio essentukiensis]
MKKYLKLLLATLIILLLVFAGKYYGLSEKFGDFREWVASKGALGPIIFMGVYALATVMAIPGSALTIMAGAIFGSIVGVVTVIFGATIGASLCFLISRYFARDFVVSLLSKSEKFKKLDDMTEKNGAIIVAITRLVPLFPFNLLNYGFGLTKVPFMTYVFWSFICMLPGTVLYVVGTDAVTTAIREGKIPWVLVAVVLLIFAILFLLVKKAKSKIKE